MKTDVTPSRNVTDVYGSGLAIRESIIPNARQLRILGYVDCGEVVAKRESLVSDARHTRGDGDCGEAAVTTESIVSNARDLIGYSLMICR